ncbi:hypothetical protein N3K66_005958 [Trichothecium roseum]|uniref:Uncharacterized protein n=1 Tax=Trichothecium roseum TaxID=47278 RepID=A0ACC0UZB6_9HYPO|nr:hypothetical protein N3K66_005958 [Trichothecium roseum]
MSATQVLTAHRQAKQQQTLHLPPKTADSQSPKAATTATAAPESPFLRIPPEIRIMIYDHLLGNGSSQDDNNEIHIRNRERRPVSRAVVPPGASCSQQKRKQRRTSYYVLERTIMRRGYETTYIHHDPPSTTTTPTTTTSGNVKVGTGEEKEGKEKEASRKREIHPSILSVNRLIHREASQRLYARSAFRFAADIEALVPFLSDLTPRTRSLVREISLRKRGGASAGACVSADSDAGEWARLCAYLAGQRREGVMRLRRLDVVVEGGKPRCGISNSSSSSSSNSSSGNSVAQSTGHGNRNGTWDGPKELSVSDLRLLYATRHDSMEWVRDLAGAGRSFAGETSVEEEQEQAAVAEEVRVRASLAPVAEPKTNMMLVHAAFSGSIETALVDFLRELGVPATSALREC